MRLLRSTRYVLDHLLLYSGNYTLLRFTSPRPDYAEIRVTEGCNSRCITCDAWKSSRQNELTTSETKDVLRQLREISVEVIRISGGEPLIRSDLSEIVEECNFLGFKEIHIATNGILLKEKAEDLIVKGATRFDVSLDGGISTNNRIRGLSGHYDMVLKGIGEVKRVERQVRRKIPITIFTTLMKQNMAEVPSLVKMCEEMGLRWCFSLLCGNLDFFRQIDTTKLAAKDWKMIDQTVDYLKKVYSEKPWLIYSNQEILEYARDYMKGKINLYDFPCVLGYTVVCIGAKGQVYPGCYVHKPIGNIRKESLEKILKSSEYRKLAEKMYKRECPNCTFYYEKSILVRQMFRRADALRKIMRSRRI